MSSLNPFDPTADRSPSVARAWNRRHRADRAGECPTRATRVLDATGALELAVADFVAARPTRPASSAPYLGLERPTLAPPSAGPSAVVSAQGASRLRRTCGAARPPFGTAVSPQSHRKLVHLLPNPVAVQSHLPSRECDHHLVRLASPKPPSSLRFPCHFPAISLPFARYHAGAGFLSFHRQFTDVSPTFSRPSSF